MLRLTSKWLLLGLLAVSVTSQSTFGQPREPHRTIVDSTVVQHAESLSEAFRQASEVVLPTVVKIRSKVEAKQVVNRRPDRDDFRGSPFEQFFGEDMFGGQFTPPMTGSGSGVIIDRDGLILTNNHVVAGADKVTVELQDGREFEASDIRTDPQSDLAILRINSDKPLEFARMGDSDKLQIGDWVLAVGNPFEFESSVSAGIISAKGRSLGSETRATFLQTDAAINPGNSGGPLVNLRGEVVGINTAIASRTGAFNGIGFAIPVNQAKWVSEQLVHGGAVSRAWLGVGVRQLSSSVRQALNINDETNGVLIGEVRIGAPSEQAGIQLGDVITHVSDHPVQTSPELQRLVEQTPLGSAIQIQLIREGQPKSVAVRAAALPTNDPSPSLPRVQGRIQVLDLGVFLHELTPENASRLKLKFTTGGLLVTAAAKEAQLLGLVPGSVIYRVGDTNVESATDLDKALESQAEAGVWKILVEVPEVSHRLILVPTRSE